MSISKLVALAAEDMEFGDGTYRASGHYAIETWSPKADGSTRLTLYHYGTPILNVTRAFDGALTSEIDPAWWGSATDMSAIGKAHRALGMRRSIKRGQLVAY
jgi:hypothetical protein